jgi:flagellar hook-associated protein 3 FlgL
MTISNVSSNYLATAMMPAITQAQSQLATLQTESASGQYADLGLQLGEQSGYELSLRNQDDELAAMTTANGLTATNMTSAQNALTAVLSSADDALKGLVTYTSDGDSPSTLQTLGQSNLQQLIALGNTNSDDSFLFGGQNLTTPPLDDYFAAGGSTAKTAIDNAFQSYFGFSINASAVANITASQLQGFLSGPYAQQFQGSNWTSNWSTASDDNTTALIAPNTTITTSTNANTAGFRDLAQGYTMLSEFGDIGLNTDASEALATAATSVINQGVSGVITTQAMLGESQSQLTAANAQMSDQMTLLQKQVGALDSIDPAQIATELQTISTQLQTSYQVTAQLHNLNLAQYLPT